MRRRREPCEVIALSVHARASAGSRAAKAVSLSAVTPADLARRVIKIERHQSEGMRSRWSHLLTAAAPAPISAANSSGESHSSMIERNERIPDMESELGHFVLNCKANLSRDCDNPWDNTGRMSDGAEKLAASEFNAAFQARTRAAREAKGYKQGRLAELLRVAQDTYKNWETRPGSLIPYEYVDLFCTLTDIEIAWLFTEAGKGPAVASRHRPKRSRRSPQANIVQKLPVKNRTTRP
jgi:hypothetical protein